MAFWRGYWTIGGALVVALALVLPLVLPEAPWWTGLLVGALMLAVAFPPTRTARRRWLEDPGGRHDPDEAR
ncbi:hypothetical protein GCM10009846_10070 [Agrococcus versicolor]|uniref:Uncharacterized protein n=1 Tax=Agrococcus versicolor TaxID=501482 RepID=A0ABP5MHZ5_9MICO